MKQPDPFTHERLITEMRSMPFRCGWLAGQLKKSSEAMEQAVSAISARRHPHQRRELVYALDAARRTLALIEEADKKE